MGDPFTISVGVIACVQGADMLCKTAIRLHDLAHEIKGAEDDISMFAMDVKTFSNVIATASLSLDDYLQDSTAKRSPIIQHLEGNSVIMLATEQSAWLKDKLLSQIPKIEGLRDIPRFWVRYKWVLRRQKLNVMCSSVESLKLTFLLMIGSIDLAMIRMERRTEYTEKKIRQLKREITSLIDQNKDLQKKLKLQETIFEDGDSDNDDFILDRNKLQSALQHIGKSLVKHKRVPGYPRSSASTPNDSEISATSSDSRDLPSSSRHDSRNFHSQGRQPPPPRLHRTSGDVSQHRSTRVVMLNESDDVSLSPSTRPPRPVLDFERVHETERIIRLDAQNGYLIEAGFIEFSGQYKRVDARYNEQMQDNVISQRFAVAHKLEIQALDEGDVYSPQLQTGEGRARPCLGMAKLKSRTSSYKGALEFSVHCRVYDHATHDIVLGRSFMEKKNHCRDGRRAT